MVEKMDNLMGFPTAALMGYWMEFLSAVQLANMKVSQMELILGKQMASLMVRGLGWLKVSWLAIQLVEHLVNQTVVCWVEKLASLMVSI